MAWTSGGSGMIGGGDDNGGGASLLKNNRVPSDGLNPHRQKGFGAAASRRIEAPTLNDMRARQGAVVGKFMNFMQRKNTIVMEL